jgi:hypothetical protein
MKLDIEKEDLLPIWHDVIESLDIMRAFKNGEVPKAGAKRLSSDGCRRLTRARNKLDKLIGNPFVSN